jgi:peptidoglycan/xylan/chitin deacetylase (PgdA/CDA1 family)
VLALRKAAGEVLRLVPTPIWRRLAPKPAIGLCYHLVSDVDQPHVRHYRPLTTTEFENDLAYLQRRFVFTSYDELSLRQEPARASRDNRVILTFDDGFAQCANVVAPILRRHGLTCIFFVITDLIGGHTLFRESVASLCIGAVLRRPAHEVEELVQELGLTARFRSGPQVNGSLRPPVEMAELGSYDRRLRPLLIWLLTAAEADVAAVDVLAERLGVNPEEYLRRVQPYLTAEQICSLHSAGFTVGAHGRSHRRLQSMSRADAEREIVGSCSDIRDLTGQATVPFAFPYFGGDIDRKWLAELRSRHKLIGLFFDTDGLSEDADFVVQRVFAERFGYDRSLDGILRRAWSRPRAWWRK